MEITPDTFVLDIFFTDGQRGDAAAGADAFAKAYLQYKTERPWPPRSRNARRSVRTIDDLKQRRDKLDERLDGSLPGTTQYQDAQAERDTVNGSIAVLESQLASISTGSDPGEIILPATRPPPRPARNTRSTSRWVCFFGLFLGVVLAFIRDRTDERITGRADLEATLDAPVLAAIPGSPVGRSAVLLARHRATAAESAAEAYRTLRSGVMAMARRRDLKVFALLSPVQGEGKTTTASNLAVTLSHTDSRVLLIAADLRRPSLYRYFQLENDVGLSDVLLGEIPLEEAIQAVSPNLWVLVSGNPPARPAELLQSHRMAELLSRQRDRFDFIIIDCPPVLGLADSLAIAPLTDAVILIASAEQTKRGAIAHALDQLSQVGAVVRAGVLNNVSLSKRNSSYGYGYGYGYGADEAPGRRGRGDVVAPRSGSRPNRRRRTATASPKPERPQPVRATRGSPDADAGRARGDT